MNKLRYARRNNLDGQLEYVIMKSPLFDVQSFSACTVESSSFLGLKSECLNTCKYCVRILILTPTKAIKDNEELP